MAQDLVFNAETIAVLDRGYTDYALFGRWTQEGVFFVIRLKENATYEVVNEIQVPENRNIRSGQIIQLSSEQAQKDCPCLLRRVVVWDPEQAWILLERRTPYGRGCRLSCFHALDNHFPVQDSPQNSASLFSNPCTRPAAVLSAPCSSFNPSLGSWRQSSVTAAPSKHNAEQRSRVRT